ncbi:MAG: hypothetical protein MUF05_01100 [Candidatus Omnitrophica bacterium]|jgi:mRNA-degrading endonuclease RelE of RelBE toxin-antitoxin system|nr:hypothetical protein [Candidatus Omnitrophota bacterium]
MRFEFKPSFEHSLKSLHSKTQEEVKNSCLKIIDILSQDRFIHKGIGLKRLKGDYWEVRHGLKTRLIFRWNKDLVEFVLVGSHDDIKRYLRKV